MDALPQPSLQTPRSAQGPMRSMCNSECEMAAAAETIVLQTDGITRDQKSASNLYDKAFFLDHGTEHSHHYTGGVSCPFLCVTGDQVHFFQRQNFPIKSTGERDLFLGTVPPSKTLLAYCCFTQST